MKEFNRLAVILLMTFNFAWAARPSQTVFVTPGNAASFQSPDVVKVVENPGMRTALIQLGLKIHETYNANIGGPIFRAVYFLFEKLGITSRNACQETLSRLPNLEGDRAEFIRKMLRELDTVQMQRPDQIASNLEIRFQESLLGKTFKDDPRILRGLSHVLGIDGVLECPLVAILDLKRIFLYVLFNLALLAALGITYYKVFIDFGVLLNLAMRFTVPLIYFAVNLYVFYLFYQAEIDRVMITFRNYYY